MEAEANSLAVLLLQLFPGFVAAWILYGLTSYPKPSQFERVAQAIVFSFVIKVLIVPEKWALLWVGQYWSLRSWNAEAALLSATLTAVAFGLASAYFANNDKVYELARRCRLTKRTAYPSEWYGAFARLPQYVVLHLKDERRISGWPLQWPSDPLQGHFELSDAAWLDSKNSEIPLATVNSILIPASNVEFVEIMKPLSEAADGSEADQSSSPAASSSSPGECEPKAA